VVELGWEAATGSSTHVTLRLGLALVVHKPQEIESTCGLGGSLPTTQYTSTLGVDYYSTVSIVWLHLD
jgi:hypothetical protein